MPDRIPSARSSFFFLHSSFFFSESDYVSVPPPPFHPIPSYPARPIQLILSPSKYESAKINLSCFGIKPAVPFVRGGKGRFSFFFFFFFFFLNVRRLHRRSPCPSPPLPFLSRLGPGGGCCFVSFFHLSPLPCFPDARMRPCVCAVVRPELSLLSLSLLCHGDEPLVIPPGCSSQRTRVPVCLQLLGLVASHRQGEADE